MEESKLTAVVPYVSLSFMFLIGLGIGASTTVDDFRSACSKPIAIAVGFLSQYLFMPVSAYLFSLAFDLDLSHAIGVILLGCSPGGIASNIFTFWSNGDVALSITMSFLSTCAAFVMMPFWLFVLVKQALGATNRSENVGFTEMISAILVIAVPTVLGLFIRRKNTVRKIKSRFIWQWIEMLSSVIGFLFIIGAIGAAFLAYGNVFADIPWTIWAIGVLFMPIGCTFGYGVSRLCGMSCRVCRTVSIETGMQNFPFTVSVIQLNFKDFPETEKAALMFPIVYAVFVGFWLPVIFLFFKYFLIPRDVANVRDGIRQKSPEETPKDVENNGDEARLENCELSMKSERLEN